MNPSTAQSRVIVDELIRCGVADAVVCPGSRSSALAIALAQAAERGDLMLHVRIDERSAGYLALGLSKISGIPTVIVTTSGTAAVNLHPALVEADESAIPLIAITADRPPTLRDVGANQTIAQVGLFGACVRWSADMSVAQERAGEVRYWRSTISRAVARATDSMDPGPVHLNIPFADPLVPTEDSAGDQEWVEALAGRPDGRPWTADARLVAGMSTPLDDVLGVLSEEASVPAHGIVIVGDHDDDEVEELVEDLADALGWPVIAEPSGNVAGCSTALAHGSLIAADSAFASQHRPDIVITVGRVGLDRAVLGLISASALHIAVDSAATWSDSTRSADLVVSSVPLAPEAAEIDEEWLSDWQRADVLAAAAVETALASEGDPLTGMHAARIVAQSVPSDGLLFIGASWPVRHVFSFAATSAQQARVIGNRGTSGIDGCISSAWGAALAYQRAGGSGCIALVGDLTFLYDSNGLIVPEAEPRPDLTIVVVDNGGGGIFSALEPAQAVDSATFERVFGTPTGIDPAEVAGALRVPVAVVTTAAGLAEALAGLAQEPDDASRGVRVIVARTCTREREAAVLRTVQGAVAAALGSA